MRLSIRVLAVIVTLLAIFFAAYSQPSSFWVGVCEAVTLVCLGIAVARAWVGSGRARAFWAAFAVIGFSYLMLYHWEQWQMTKHPPYHSSTREYGRKQRPLAWRQERITTHALGLLLASIGGAMATFGLRADD